jgi:hypothetical protein
MYSDIIYSKVVQNNQNFCPVVPVRGASADLCSTKQPEPLRYQLPDRTSLHALQQLQDPLLRTLRHAAAPTKILARAVGLKCATVLNV